MHLILILFLYIGTTEVHLKELTEFYRNETLDGYKCPATKALFELTSFGETQCTMMCSQTFTCIGVFFVPSSGRCIGCTSQFDTGVKEALTNSTFYRRRYHFSYIGCFDDLLPHRILNGKYTSTATMTTEECIYYCMQGNYTHALTELYNWCFCGSGLVQPTNKRPESECTTYCAGNPSQICGASFRGSLYVLWTLLPYQAP